MLALVLSKKGNVANLRLICYYQKVNFIYSCHKDVEEHLPLKAFDNHVVLKDEQMVHRYV